MNTTPIVIQNSAGIPIHSVEEWSRLAPPKEGGKQWKDGRSAKELAKAWFRNGIPQVPDELESLFQSHLATKDLQVTMGTPEAITRLDSFSGGQRNHDLILRGQNKNTQALVAIEAKADEPFGDLIEKCLARAALRSKLPDRIRHLSCAILGRPIDHELGQLRYQLLHGLGGTLIEARKQKASLALFIVHEFVSGKTDMTKLERNAADWVRFVHALPGCQETNLIGKLVGPINVPGGEFVPSGIPILLGKVTTHL